MKLLVNGINKSYNGGKSRALDGFNTEFTPGVYGILGPNGAGKSTLMNILTDNMKPDSGEILYNNENIYKLGRKFREIIGYMPQQQGIYDEFTGERFLWYMAALKGLKRRQAKEKINYVLELVNMKEYAYKKMKFYSGGMKQRILIAQSLLNDPKILILDEPTAGLDPRERIRIRNFISEISIDKIVIIATHVVSDIEYIAKEIILMKSGKIIKQNKPSNLLNGIEGKVFEVYLSKDELNDIQKKYMVSNITAQDEKDICVRIVGEIPPEKYQSNKVKANLEDVYLYYFYE